MIKQKAFTLMELMVVIAIIACLSALALPNLMKFLAKAKRTEAYLYLRILGQAEKAYFAEHGMFTKNITGPQGLGFIPEGTCNYTYGFPQGAAGESYLVGSLNTPASALKGASLTKNGFVICAAGLIYGDKPDVLSIDQNMVIKIVSDALA